MSLLNGKPIKAVLIKAQGIELGGHLEARVGPKDWTWEDRGANDGCVSHNLEEPDEGSVALGWLVYNTFLRPEAQLEVVIRVMSRNHRMVGKGMLYTVVLLV